MTVLYRKTTINAPLDRVFDLARSIDLHAGTMARWRESAVEGVTTGLIENGQEVTWKARHFKTWHRLTSRITAFHRPHYFRDEMLRGPFRRLAHDHYFIPTGEGTVMLDVFVYQPPLSVLGFLADALFLKRRMGDLLSLRNTCIKETAESHLWKKYIPTSITR